MSVTVETAIDPATGERFHWVFDAQTCLPVELIQRFLNYIAKRTKVDMIWVAGRSPTLVSHSLHGVAMNLKATTLTYLAVAKHTKVDMI